MKKFICGVSFQYELGECDDIHFYDSLEGLKEESECWQQCGVVLIDFLDENYPELYTSFEWVVKQDMKWGV